MRVSRLNTIFWLLWLCAVLWCYFNAYDDPSSIFFNPSLAYRPSYSAVREAQVRSFLDRTLSQPQISTSTVSRENEFLCVGIPSHAASRSHHDDSSSPNFLETALGSLVDTLSEPERASIHIKVLLADKDARSHPSYGARWLERLADDVLVYDYESTDSNSNNNNNILEPEDAYQVIPYDLRATKGGRSDSRIENTRLDHSVLFEACRKHGSAYFALFQDDVITSKDWLQRVWRGIAEIELQKKPVEKGHDWLYFRAFHSQTGLRWTYDDAVRYTSGIVAGYVILGVLVVVFIRVRRYRGGEIKTATLAQEKNERNAGSCMRSGQLASLVIGLWIPACVVVMLLAGRNTMNRLTTFHWGVREAPQKGCSAQGLVFPYRHLQAVEEALREPPYDVGPGVAMDKLVEAKGWSKWDLYPSVLQHIGFGHGSSGGKQMEAVWNFGYERFT